jgi:hypothetical protein
MDLLTVKTPRKLYRNEIRKYFSHVHYDNLSSLWGHDGIKIVQDNDGKWYEASYDSGKIDGAGWNGSIRLKVIKKPD